jgi:lipoprotein-releasing system ATP-binding protein
VACFYTATLAWNPTAVDTADIVFDLMREVNRESGTSVLMVTHNLELAQRCDRIIDLVDGRIVR